MMKKIFVATRKGLITLTSNKSTGWRIAKTDFLGDPVSMVLPDPRDGTLYAALNLGHFGTKLHRQRPGKTWQECAVPAFAPGMVINDTDKKPASVVMIWSLEAGGGKDTGSLWAGTIPGGLFHSRDGGDSWSLVESLWQEPKRAEWGGGGYDQPGIHSICVNPHNADHVTIAVSSGGVWVTEDHGTTWQVRAKGMRAAYMPPELMYEPNAQDPHRLVQCAANPKVFWVQHHNGIFHSTDSAASWQEITDVKPSVFGFATAVHPHDPATAWFVPAVKDECRVPVDQKMVVTRTRDSGKSFDVLHAGLPQEHAYDLVYRHGLDVDPSGNCLVLGSTTGGLWYSDNQGDSWQSLAQHLPPIYSVRFGE